jgi:putative ABC transport system permease protein
MGSFRPPACRLKGRLPSDAEFATNASVIVVSETTAHEYWPGQSAIGQSLVQGGEGRLFSVVGVVGDARYISLDRDVQGVIYAPVSGNPHPSVGKVLVRFAHADSRSLEPVVSYIVARCPGCWLSGAEMLRDALSMSISGREFSAILFAGFGVAALVIVGTAVLGVVAMSTNRRTREIGVRMALGATGGDVMRQIVWEQVSPVVVGLALGAVVATWAARFVTTYLYRTPTYDPWSWLAAIVAILVIALTGAIVPSRRASRVDPVQALRVE